jgi:DNA repair protein RadC
MELSELETVYQSEQRIKLKNAQTVFEEAKDLRTWTKEAFVVFCLDAELKIISREIISIGILNSCIIHPREIYRTAIRRNANSIIVAHNHPSGNLTPSLEDINITNQLKQAGDILQIPMMDHVIITKNGYHSI